MLVFRVIFGIRTATKLQNNFGIMQIFWKVFFKKICVYAHKKTGGSQTYGNGVEGQVGWEAIWLYTLKAGLYAKSGFLWIVCIKTTP